MVDGSPKIVLIGAGSHVFGMRLVIDVLSYPELRDCVISLMDIDPERLRFMEKLAKKIVSRYGFDTRVEATTDRREALNDADYVVVSIRAGGMEATRLDLEIPAKYGVNQSVGDTVGPGGVFYGLRNGFALLEIAHDMEEVCPKAWLLNYTNPMAILSWVVNDYTDVKYVGLCHSIPNTAATLARYIGAPFDEVSYLAAGINHMAWFLEFKWRGRDAYPLLRERLSDPVLYTRPEEHPAGGDLVRVEVFKALGYYVSESSRHLSEYLPYFRKRKELIAKYRVPTSAQRLEGLERAHARRDEYLRKLLEGETPIRLERSNEFCAQIIHSMETGEPTLIYGNVKNTGLITNLPYGCIVEVPCRVDDMGIHPYYIGDLPPQCAALNRMNINVQELAVKAIAERSRERVFQAVMVDPLTSAILTIEEIRRMVDEMFEAEKEYLPEFE